MSDQIKRQEPSLERQALAALRKMRQKLSELEDARSEPIAIIGIGCRLPGSANDPELFWDLLRNGVDAIREIPADRWQLEEHFDPDPGQPGKTYSKWGGFMDQIDQFDPEFFGISPREAVHMDPQQRVFLEVGWEALEDAGIPATALKGTSTGVFVGTTMTDYLQQHLRYGDPSDLDAYIISGNTMNAIAGRLAYFLGIHGPSITLDTACSSSLVAVDRACRSLRDGECTLAIAGGVNLILAPDMFVCMSKWGMLSPDGRCKTFDARANGFVRAEGCGVIVLKRLSAAQADGDRVLALIRGSAVNQDGPSSGLSVPNGRAQEAVIRQALSNGKVEPAAVTYVEAHGTGTSLGDPIEIDALGRVFQASRERPVFLGSVKTNLGHLEAAAGITGLLKVVLMLRHRRIPPHLHLNQLSPHVSWQQYPFVIPTEIADWNSGNGKRIAGVSSFGFSGTNAHVILEESTETLPAARGIDRPLHLLTLSAREKDALRTTVANVADRLKSKIPPSYADLCYTANVGRCHFGQRLSLLCSTGEEAHEKLTAFLDGEMPTGLMTSQSSVTRRPKLAFLFTGQGSQYVHMGALLYQTSPTFRKVLDQCDELLRPYLDRPLLSVLYPLNEPGPLLDQTLYAQPALFALEFALYRLWASWGIAPDFVLGHGVGEYVAACVAGVFSLEDGLKLIAKRARLMQSQPPGGRMVAVRASEEQVRAAIKPWQNTVTVAAINGPRNIVISGASADIETVLRELASAGAPARDLNVSHAFHSQLMESILADFEKMVAEIPLQKPTIRLVSNLTGQVAKPEELTRPEYWRNHLREPVRFGPGIQTLFDLGCDAFLEVGPNPVLSAMGQQCTSRTSAIWRSTLRQGRNDWSESLASLQALYHEGVPVDWKGFDHDYPRRKIRLPTYPFQRQRFWFKPRSDSNHSARASGDQNQRSCAHSLLGDLLRSPALEKTVFQSQLSAQRPAFLEDHQICDAAILPAAAYVEMALAGANQILGRGIHRVEELSLDVALRLDFDQQTLVQAIFQPNTEESAAFEVFSSSQDGSDLGSTWTSHVKGRVARVTASEGEGYEIGLLNSVRGRCAETVNTTVMYETFGRQGAKFGLAFRNIRALWRGEGETLAEIALADSRRSGSANYRFHPALLDACFQAAVQVLPESVRTAEDEILLPVNIEAVQILRPLPATLWSHASWRVPADCDGRTFTLDLRIYDSKGQTLARIEGLRLKRVQPRALRQTRSVPEKDWLFEIQWRETPRPCRALTGGSKLLGRSGTWLVLADKGGMGESIRDRLFSLGQTCVLVRPGSSFICRSDHEFQLNPASRPDFERLLREVGASEEKPVKGVLHLWSLDLPDFREMRGSDLARSQLLGCGAALHLVQAIASFKTKLSPRLWLVTRGAQALPDSSAEVQAATATLWGLGQVIAAEYPELSCTRIDLDQQHTKENSGALLSELFCDESEEDAVVFRNQSRFTPRLTRLATEALEPDQEISQPLRLGISQVGILENLRWLPMKRTLPGWGEVEIQVQATGLNFRDVLQTLGMYPGKIGYLGAECVGTVARIGEGVSGLQPGDQVMAVAPDAFSTHVTVRLDHVARLPAGMSIAEAASIPVAFLTTFHGLHRLAHIKAGDRVLIHAAAGGVGLAAVQLARCAGAEVFATAGSLEKQNYLRTLGIAHVFDSRSTAFAAEIMRRTDERGVDIVLNSLAGDFIQKSASVLSPAGRFLELGKRGILNQEEFAALRPDCSYYAYDLGDEAFADSSLLPAMFTELLAAFSRRELTPLPVTVFSEAQVVDAFRFMAQAKHIGKIVVTKSNLGPATHALPIEGLRADFTYLITGGFRGLGLETARWMIREGARKLVLVGRCAPDPDTEAILHELTLEGAQIAVETCDVSQADQVDKMLGRVSESMPPLRGIIHAAGVLDDGTIEQQTWSRFERVSAPKVLGAWNLHQRTLSLELDFFVLFSAAATLIGSPGQGNYAAANAFMDALAHHRRSRGLAALSINWGAWSGTGMASRLTARDTQRWISRGLRPIGLAEGMSKLGQLLFCSRAQIVALPVDWSRMFADPGSRKPPSLLLEVISESRGEATQAGAPSNRDSVLARLAAEPATRRLAILQEHVQSLASRALGRTGNRSLDPRRPLHELGLDSLLSVELRNALASSLDYSLPATLLFDYPTVESLTRHLAKELSLELASEVSPAAVEATGQSDLRGLENMSESEAESLLLVELDELKASGT
jgi:acyl transferase domain-containing protein/NADPH:quinone reductase-like Zn-dependent oxidoreductase/NAD(P)-dependent dehydrogenase (short-subunit alcohol dehydrogenase family)/acyl carrier protein